MRLRVEYKITLDLYKSSYSLTDIVKFLSFNRNKNEKFKKF